MDAVCFCCLYAVQLNTTDIPLWCTSAADVKRNIHLTASSSVTTRQCSSKLVIALAVPSLDGDPDGLTPTLGLDDLLLQAVNPDAAVEHFADFAVLAYEDATFGVFRRVARMDSDALELRYTEQDGQPCPKLLTPRNHHGIYRAQNEAYI